MDMIERYRTEIVGVTNKYLDELIKEIYTSFGFTKMFVHNFYEGEGISVTTVAFHKDDEIYLFDDLKKVFADYMEDSTHVDIDESEKDDIAVLFEMLMYNSYGFDWYITAEYIPIDEENGNVIYSVHVLESENLDL